MGNSDSRRGVPQFSDEAARSAWWTDRVHEWQSSGTSQTVYARARGIPLGTFYWWKGRVVKAEAGRRSTRLSSAVKATHGKRAAGRVAKSAESAFLPVRVVSGEAPLSWWLEVSCRSGRVVRLREAMDLKQLSSLIAVLES